MVHPIAQIAFSAFCSWFLFHLSNKDAILKHAQLMKELGDIKAANGLEVAAPSTQPIGQIGIAERCDHCFDLTLRRVAGGSLAGAVMGGLLFSSLAARVITIAF